MSDPNTPDDLDWNIDRDGRMAEFAVEPADEVETVPYIPEA